MLGFRFQAPRGQGTLLGDGIGRGRVPAWGTDLRGSGARGHSLAGRDPCLALRAPGGSWALGALDQLLCGLFVAVSVHAHRHRHRHRTTPHHIFKSRDPFAIGLARSFSNPTHSPSHPRPPTCRDGLPEESTLRRYDHTQPHPERRVQYRPLSPSNLTVAARIQATRWPERLHLSVPRTSCSAEKR